MPLDRDGRTELLIYIYKFRADKRPSPLQPTAMLMTRNLLENRSMSTVPPSTPSKQRKGKKENNCIQTQQNTRLKIVVRRLPPNLPEEIFWQSVLPWVAEDTTTWKVFYPGKLRRR